MAGTAQGVIEAIVRALEQPPMAARHVRKPVITFSRTTGSGGDRIAEAVAERLDIECYDKEIINGIAAEANVSRNLMENLTERLDAVDAWIYSAVFGKHVSRDEYAHFLSVVIRGLYHTGVSEQEGTSYAEAKREVQNSNKRRGKFVWDIFHSRYNDPTNFDLIVNTDYFRRLDDVVEIVLHAVRARGLDRRPTQAVVK